VEQTSPPAPHPAPCQHPYQPPHRLRPAARALYRPGPRHPEPAPAGIAARQVDLASADSLASAYEGADGVFIHLPMGAPEAAAAQARAVVEAVTRARPGRVVISTSGQIVDQPGSPLQAPADSPIMTLIDGVTGRGAATAPAAPRHQLV